MKRRTRWFATQSATSFAMTDFIPANLQTCWLPMETNSLLLRFTPVAQTLNGCLVALALALLLCQSKVWCPCPEHHKHCTNYSKNKVSQHGCPRLFLVFVVLFHMLVLSLQQSRNLPLAFNALYLPRWKLQKKPWGR